MFCTQCGNDVEHHARFCSKCGLEVTATASTASAQSAAPQPDVQQKKTHDMDMHVNILGWLLVGSGILTGIAALIVLFVGQVILTSLPIHWPPDVPIGMPYFVTRNVTIAGLGIGALAAAVAAAGVGLLQYRSWARSLAILMSVLLLFHFPIGTAVAVYAFWVLFSRERQGYYKAKSASTMA